jgi:hypothetical protein
MQKYKCDICGGDWEHPNYFNLCGFCDIYKKMGLSDFEILKKRIDMHYNILFKNKHSEFRVLYYPPTTRSDIENDLERMMKRYDDV